jgi:hypothetical protein
VGQSVVTTPAVNTATGDIFVVVNSTQEGVEGFQSQIVRVNSAGQVLAASTVPLQTTASPRLWGDYLFITSQDHLYVFAQPTMALIAEDWAGSCFNLVCGDGPIDFSYWLETLYNVVVCLATGLSAEKLDIADCGLSFEGNGVESGVFTEPAVMIVDESAITGDAGRPTLVVATGQCLKACRFDPSAATEHDRLEVLWSEELVHVDCDFDTRRLTSPALIAGDQVILGDSDGVVESHDVRTGALLWTQNVGSFVQCPPVGFVRQIYVATATEFVTLDSDGSIISRMPIRGIGGGAAMSKEFVYLATREGIHTFDLDPTEGFAFDGSIVDDSHVGVTTPALASDGTVYVTTPDGFLHAYGATGSLARQVIVPSAEWIEPVDGAPISYAVGQELALSLSDGYGEPFKGQLAIESDIDGLLCAVESQGATGGCRTIRRLSLGAHKLTAFATDESGGTIPAAIIVEVINTPPAVAILAPAHGASFSDGAEVALRASYTDPDEAGPQLSRRRDREPELLPAHRVRWRSSRDGDLGAGPELNVVLSLGEHEITATASDELGETANASIKVVIQEIIE